MYWGILEFENECGGGVADRIETACHMQVLRREAKEPSHCMNCNELLLAEPGHFSCYTNIPNRDHLPFLPGMLAIVVAADLSAAATQSSRSEDLRNPKNLDQR